MRRTEKAVQEIQAVRPARYFVQIRGTPVYVPEYHAKKGKGDKAKPPKVKEKKE
jgi:hypothetical protein